MRRAAPGQIVTSVVFALFMGIVVVGVGTTPTISNIIVPDSDTPTLMASITATLPARPDTVGAFINGDFYLSRDNGLILPTMIVPFNPYGVNPANLLPVAGDWNGDGIDKVGIYDTSVGVFLLADSNSSSPAIQYALVMGNPGDEPIAGHWDATMTGDGVGVYRPTNGLLYVKRTLTSGYADYTMVLGNPGDHGLAGDWDGDGFDSVGVFRPVNTMFYLANALGGTTQLPAIIYSDYNFVFGPNNLLPFAGAWIFPGRSYVGYMIDGIVYLKYSHSGGPADKVIVLSSPGAHPVSGQWWDPYHPTVTATFTPLPTITNGPSPTATLTPTQTNTPSVTPTATLPIIDID